MPGHVLTDTELNLLHDFQGSVDDWYAPGFELCDFGCGSGGYPEVADRLRVFALANESGSTYAVWLLDDRADLAQLPVVFLGDEGGVHLGARDMRQFFRIVASGWTPSANWKAIGYTDDRGTDAGQGFWPANAAFRAWLRRHFGLEAAEDPNSVAVLTHWPDAPIRSAPGGLPPRRCRACSVGCSFEFLAWCCSVWGSAVGWVRGRGVVGDRQATDEFGWYVESYTAQRILTERVSPMTELNAGRVRQAIVEQTRRLAESAVAAGPEAAVPTAPKWTVLDLVAHVGQTQHWVAEIIERRITDPSQLPGEMAVVPVDPREWLAWLSESAQRVAGACSDVALDAPVFNPAGDGRPGARFWMSSMLNEAVVHGVDAAGAAGRPADVEADIAAALVSNHLAMLTSPTWEMQRSESAHAIRGTGQRLQWVATDIADGAGAWFVERRPDGAVWMPGVRPADVTVSGPARSLLLALTRRLPLVGGEAAGVRVEGEVGLAQHWLDNTAHVSG
ncbi:maleylpyruvate isomerase family mycothiol-dependent enzyme [Streptomyces sp. RKAG293]|uniref:maleylpyruvate isomerase family mycothiol-dependent enzyme n=1 Tax=Streptomyces sp. RKAG293 TaxID=2893403 RepID=UPI0020339092|nr:maleylpyruvate isomerase family mycothiol-dependent enzyme [Streptomyces sp. RKAG293]MCM2416628.1 maleylpyruvate isomerase family mycothiol-dependent enzyme [Streptomyces sp. RKAG293]